MARKKTAGKSRCVEVGAPDITALWHVVRELRGPDGCPWDRAQTQESLASCLVEEASEAMDAIMRSSQEHVCDELGDLLYLLLMHMQMAAEAGAFTPTHVVDGACAKLRRRHPHVFGDEKAANADEVVALWGKIKAGEPPRQTLPPGEASLPTTLRVWKKWRRETGRRAELAARLETVLREATQAGEAAESGNLWARVAYLALAAAAAHGVDPEQALRRELAASEEPRA